jgi:SNF2 family DNA or RNA helicase
MCNFNNSRLLFLKVVYKGVPEVRRQIFKDEVEPGNFNVLLTTYEYIMKDRSHLKRLYWQYIIVDEGHRMKNAESKFAQTLGIDIFIFLFYFCLLACFYFFLMLFCFVLFYF